VLGAPALPASDAAAALAPSDVQITSGAAAATGAGGGFLPAATTDMGLCSDAALAGGDGVAAAGLCAAAITAPAGVVRSVDSAPVAVADRRQEGQGAEFTEAVVGVDAHAGERAAHVSTEAVIPDGIGGGDSEGRLCR